MRRRHLYRPVLLATAALLALRAGGAHAVEFTYQHRLSTGAGIAPFTGAALAFDPRANETLVVSRGRVHVFGDHGMQVHAFGGDEDLPQVVAVAPLADGGDYLVLLSDADGNRLARCDYRGALVERIPLSRLPAEFPKGFSPRVVAVVDGQVWLADEGRSLVVVVTAAGEFVRSIDLRTAIGAGDEKGYADPSVRGLSIDARGNVLFTVPTLFRAFVVPRKGEAVSFGTKGSAPGKFNVVVAITSDERGLLYVIDMLRCVVSVFDEKYEYVGQLGWRGEEPEGLIAPNAVVARNGKVWVSQAKSRGVSVFARVVEPTS